MHVDSLCTTTGILVTVCGSVVKSAYCGLVPGTQNNIMQRVSAQVHGLGADEPTYTPTAWAMVSMTPMDECR